ncbi:adenosylcobinamide-GDP ribazoletransferase [Nocardioides marinus]|uniref:Adenosylcobinamide-GDP ribazoletransferase n=1 Tax=Nocardioides marinus TaxID=374514 RepID=A0A7Y9YC94_9ACTN|nr:adenosylcobinamide-GDP ribazoletransferase [Nocardioides marinus]
MRDPLLLALGTLTTVPVPAPRRVDPRVAGRAMLAAPAAVLPLGVAVGVLLVSTAALDLAAPARGLLAVLVLALGTRALHWDGLSDVADGLTASYDRERSLAVMRTGTSGPAGTLAVVLVAGLQATGFAVLSGSTSGCLLAAGCVLGSRVALATGCARPVPSARSDGLGATVAGTVPVPLAATSWLLLAALLATLAGPVPAGAAVLVAAVATVLLLRRCTTRLGGVTGDVLGAGVEISLAALLLTLA